MHISTNLFSAHQNDRMHLLNFSESISLNKLIKIFKDLTSLTSLYQDSQGHLIQLYKTQKYGLIGAVIDQSGHLAIISGKNIRTPFDSYTNPEKLIYSLEKSKTKTWDLAYDTQRLTLTIWPHMIGAGGEVREIRIKGSPLRYTSEEEVIKLLNRSGYKPKHGDPNAWTNEKKGIEVHIDRKGEGNANHDVDHLDLTYLPEKSREMKEKKKIFYNKQNEEKKIEIENRVKNGQLTQREGKKEIYSFEKKIDEQNQKHDNFRQKWRFAYGQERPTPSISKPTPNNLGLKNPANKDFEQTLQQTRLTDSYNSTHPNNPMPTKQGVGGDIGGVACSTEYIKGLFDSPESIFEQDHFFYLPQFSDGKLPFTDIELKQILRELAIGIYTYGTVPFFSLHFNHNGDQFPVIHPAYKNTLVGRVIGLLDYYMKGYLNGGVFKENFIDEWFQDPNWNTKSASSLQQLIDFDTYCQEKLKKEDRDYISLRTIQQNLGIKSSSENFESFLGNSVKESEKTFGSDLHESAVLKNFSGFQTTFRIIATQNSFQKKGNVFVIDADFKVLYTINPSPEYKEALDQHFRKYGEYPSSYRKLEEAYKTMCIKIHDHMVKMPLCRNYFEMLSLINFLSSYFSTLKKHRKIPVLPLLEIDSIKGCPSLFPHLPIKAYCQEYFRINTYKIFEKFLKNKKLSSFLFNFITEICKSKKSIILDDYQPKEKSELYNILESYIKENILSLCSPAMLRYLKRAEHISTTIHISTTANKISLTLLNQFLETFQSLMEKDYLNTRPDGMIVLHMVKNFLDSFLKQQLNQNKNISVGSIVFNIARIKPELTFSEVENGKKIVGGCGMELKIDSIQESYTAMNILHHNYSKMENLKPETWEKVQPESDSKSGGFLFRLLNEDVPAWIHDDYEWMESLLLINKGSSEKNIKIRIKILESMSAENKEKFLYLINKASNLTEIKDKHNRTLLHNAAMLPDPFYVKALLKKNLSISKKDEYGYLPIHYAAMCDTLETITYLIGEENSQNILNAQSYNGSTPLTVAVQHNQLRVTTWLLNQKVLIISNSAGYNILHCAFHQGNPAIIKQILSYEGLDKKIINEQSEEGGTPLMLACEIDSPLFVEQLIKLSADPTVKRKDGITAIEIAIVRNCLPVLEVLLKYASPTEHAIEEAARSGSVAILKSLTKKKNFFTYKNSCKDNALHISIRNGNISGAIFIIEQCQDFNYLCSQNIEKETPFSLAAGIGVWEIIEHLLNKKVIKSDIIKASIQQLLKHDYHPLLKKIFNEINPSPTDLQEYLLIAAQTGNNLAISQLLIPKKVNLESINGTKGWKILHYLAKSDGLFLLKRLIGNATDILHPLYEEGNKTLPYIAAENSSPRVLKILLELIKNQKISLNNHFNDRHLFYALIEAGDLSCIEILLDIFKEEDIVNSILDNEKTYPLHLAAKMGSEIIFKLLIKKGARIDVRDKYDYTPLFYAIRAGAINLVLYLINELKFTITPQVLFAAVNQPDKNLLSIIMDSNQSARNLSIALLLAVYAHNREAFSTLKSYGASVEYVSRKGWTPLLYASATGQYEILSEILKMNPNESLISGNNALHLACKNGHINCALLLLEAGYTDKKNQEGLLAIDLAKNSVSIQILLKEDQIAFQKQINTFLKALENIKNLNIKFIENIKNNISNASILDDPLKLIHLLDNLPINEILLFDFKGQKTWKVLPHFLIKISKTTKINSLLFKLLERSDLDPNIVDHKGNALAHLLLKGHDSLLKDTFSFSFIKKIDLSLKNHQGQTPLHLAAGHSNFKILKSLLEASKSLNIINSIDNQGRTPIFYAISANRKENVQLLINYGADLNQSDYKLFTPLLLTCLENKLLLFKLLIRGGADINYKGTLERITPLHLTITNNLDEMTRQLLFKGAKSNILTPTGLHPIHLAASINKTCLISIFAAKGISLNLKANNGFCPIHFAAEQGNIKAISTIISMEEDSIDRPIEANGIEEKLLHPLNGATPLHLAALHSQNETVQYLLDLKADPETLDMQDKSVLDFASLSSSKSTLELLYPYKLSKNTDLLCHAVQKAIQIDNIDAVIALYQRGIPINTDVHNGYNGLQIASQMGALQSTQWLLQNGANPYFLTRSQTDSFELSASNDSYEQFSLLLEYAYPDLDLDASKAHGKTLLHISAQVGNLKHIILLIKLGASLNIIDNNEYTPLHYAAKSGHTNVVEILLACGADSKIRNSYGMSALELVQPNDFKTKNVFNKHQMVLDSFKYNESRLELAIRSKNPLAVLILSHMEDVNQQDKEGFSALHLAAQTSQIDSIIYLLRAGANINQKDSSGKTPLWYACLSDFATAEFLIKAKADYFIKDNSHISLIEMIQKSECKWKNKLLKIFR